MRSLRCLAAVAGVLALFSPAVFSAQPEETPSADKLPFEGYLIWTDIREPDTGGVQLFAPHHVFIDGRFRCGRVQVRVERFCEGPFADGAVEETSRVVTKIAERIAGLEEIESADALLPNPDELGEEWFWPWKLPKRFGGFETTEAEWRESNLLDPRQLVPFLVAALGTMSDEDYLQAKKKAEEELEKFLKNPDFGGLLSLATGGDTVRQMEGFSVATREEAIARAEALSAASDWAANQYERARPNGRKSDVPDYVEHDGDQLTIHVFVYGDEAPLGIDEELVEKACDVTRQRKTAGLEFKTKNEQEALEEITRQRDELQQDIESLAARDLEPSEADLERLAKLNEQLQEQAAAVAATTTFKVDYEWYGDDDFWRWYVKFRSKAEENLSEVNVIRTMLQIEHGRWQQTRHEFLKLLKLDQETYRLSEDEPPERFSMITAAARRGMKEKRDALAAAKKGSEQTQHRLVRRAKELLQELADSADRQHQKSTGHFQLLADTRGFYQAQADVIELELYDQLGLVDALQGAYDRVSAAGRLPQKALGLFALKIELHRVDEEQWRQMTRMILAPPKPGTPIDQRVLEQRLRALARARAYLQANPGDPAALEIEKNLDLHFLNRIATKLEQERKASWEAWYKYLSERGYDTNDPASWFSGIREAIYVTATSGPVGHLSLGKMWAKEDAVVGVQEEVAQYLTSLLAMSRLRKNGVRLVELRALGADGLAEKMVFHTPGRTPLPADKARRITQDILETFGRLPELQALAEGDGSGFLGAFKQETFVGLDQVDTWAEWYGDALSPLNLITTLGPCSVAKVGGKWVGARPLGWTAKEAQLIKLGQATTGSDLMIKTLRLEQLADGLMKTGTGKWLAKAMAEDEAYLATLAWDSSRTGMTGFLANAAGAGELGLNIVSRLSAAVVITAGAEQLAYEYGSNVPGLYLFVRAVGELGVADVAFDVFARKGLSQKLVRRRIDQFDAHLQTRRQNFDADHAAWKDLDKLRREAADSDSVRRLTPEEVDQFTLFSPGGRDAPEVYVVGSSAAGDRSFVMRQYVNSYDDVSTADAEKSALVLRKMFDDEADTLKDQATTLARARRVVDDMEASRVVRKMRTVAPDSPAELRLIEQARLLATAEDKFRLLASHTSPARARQLLLDERVCFLRGTLVRTPDGFRQIETLEPGDLVLSRNEQTGEQGYKPIRQIFRSTTPWVCRVTVARRSDVQSRAHQRGRSTPHRVGTARRDDGDDDPDSSGAGTAGPALRREILCTPGHDFFRVDDAAWTDAAALQPGQRLLGDNGRIVFVEDVQVRAATAATWNFEVDDWHTYFVAADLGPAVWVHNKCYIGIALDQLPPGHMRVNGEPIRGPPKLGDDVEVWAINPENNTFEWMKLRGDAGKSQLDGDHVFPKNAFEKTMQRFRQEGFQIDSITKTRIDGLMNGTDNLRPMPSSFNRSKGNRNISQWKETPLGGQVGADYLQDLDGIQRSVAEELNQILNEAAGTRGSDFTSWFF